MTKYLTLIFCLLFFLTIGYGQEDCFPKHTSGVFVYDKGNVLSPSQEQSLQLKLRDFTNRTSNVIIVLTVPDLCGYDKSQYAIEYGDQKGVGREDLENGIVFLVKPKTTLSRGEIFIAIGTGLQGAITDAGTRRIIDYEVIPYFKQNSYSGGINAGVETLMQLASGEISEDDYKAQGSEGFWIILVFFIILFIVFFLAQKYGDGGDDWENYDRNGKHRGGGRSSGIPWIFIGGGGGSRGGGFGGGGFGGFGGGGFSGGGAGGSW